ncbi:hypothetical protein [Inquilinus sp.]|jgi:hypothetical protein|uniref:hypothetical protein n=1 Tax=Inquilinus sp. TaxID=1932117 RepID=UPI0037848AF4
MSQESDGDPGLLLFTSLCIGLRDWAQTGSGPGPRQRLNWKRATDLLRQSRDAEAEAEMRRADPLTPAEEDEARRFDLRAFDKALVAANDERDWIE